MCLQPQAWKLSGVVWKKCSHFFLSSKFICSRLKKRRFFLTKFICSRIKKRREPRVTVVTLELCEKPIHFFPPFFSFWFEKARRCFLHCGRCGRWRACDMCGSMMDTQHRSTARVHPPPHAQIMQGQTRQLSHIQQKVMLWSLSE